jgi:WD40 repeat protein
VGLKTNNLSQISYDQLVKMSVKNSEINIITKANEIKSLKFSPYSKIQNITKDGYSLILEDGILDLEEGSIVNNSKTADVSWINSIVLDDGNIGIVNTGQTDFWNKINKGKVTITIFDSRDYSVLTTKKIEYDLTEGIQTAALSHDGAMLATGLYDGSLILWNVNSKEQIAIIRAHDSISGMGQYAAFRKIIFSNDGALLATVGYDGNVKVWNTADLKEIKSVRGNDPVFSKDGRYLAYSLSDNRIQVLPIFEEVYPITFDGKYSWVSKIMFFNEDKFLITGGYPGVIKIWSIADNSLIVELPQFTSVGNFVLDPKEERLYISTTDGIISVWGNNPKQ